MAGSFSPRRNGNDHVVEMHSANMPRHPQNPHESQVKFKLLNANHRRHVGAIVIVDRQVFAGGAHLRKGRHMNRAQLHAAREMLRKRAHYPVARPVIDIFSALIKYGRGNNKE